MRKKKSWAAAVLMGAAALLLNGAARASQPFAEWYASQVYPFWVNTLGRLLSLFPFSWGEFLLYGGLLLLGFRVVRGAARLIRRKEERGCRLQAAARQALWIASVLLLAFTLGAGVNYQRKTFRELSGLPLQESSQEELEALCRELAEAVKADAGQVRRDEEGLCQPGPELRAQAAEAMGRLGETYDFLGGYYPLPKPVGVSALLSVQKVTGIYSPFTLEANYNREIPGYNLPHTLCHELSHLKGFMREDEANFIAWLACIGSDVPEFRYSGNLTAFVYAGNALAAADGAAYREIRASLPADALADLDYNNWFWSQYDGPVAEAANQLNDTYLMANRQEDGVKSYGRMVDLLLAYKRACQD